MSGHVFRPGLQVAREEKYGKKRLDSGCSYIVGQSKGNTLQLKPCYKPHTPYNPYLSGLDQIHCAFSSEWTGINTCTVRPQHFT